MIRLIFTGLVYVTAVDDDKKFPCTNHAINNELYLKSIGEELGKEGLATHCEFVKSEQTECPDDASEFAFTEIYYCHFEENLGSSAPIIFLPVALLSLVIAMYLLSSTADIYLSPALEAISEKLNCSESLAGVTLLAFGNGAPDLFAAISAGGTTVDQNNLLMSNLFGGVFLVSTIVLYLVLKASQMSGDTGKKIQVTK